MKKAKVRVEGTQISVKVLKSGEIKFLFVSSRKDIEPVELSIFPE